MSENWKFATIWNQSLDMDRQRPYEKRDYIYASELGRGYYDRYQKMQGREPTTPPNARARRKFEAGNLTEWVVMQVLIRAGVLNDFQETFEDNTGLLRVRGRCDYIAGGEIKKIKTDDMGLPESFAVLAEAAIDKLREAYPEGLTKQGLELKSCSAMMFERYEIAPSRHHALQAFFYAKSTNLPFRLIYLSRDDLRMCEWVIEPQSRKWQKEYNKDIEAMAQVIGNTNKQNPIPKEPLLTWDGEKFGKNFEVEYSNYLTDYGFERPDQYSELASKAASSLNYVIKRIKEGKKLTDTNLNEHLPTGYRFMPEAKDIIDKLMEENHAE